MTVLANLRRAVHRLIPGTPANIGWRKRRLEDRLKAAGLSTRHAQSIVSARFRKL